MNTYVKQIAESLNDYDKTLLRLLLKEEMYKKQLFKISGLNRFKFDLSYRKLTNLLLIDEQPSIEDKRNYVVKITQYGMNIYEGKNVNESE